MGIRSEHWREYWDKVNANAARSVERGIVTVKFHPTIKYGRIAVLAPYNEQFISWANQINGTWRPRTKSWHFSGKSLRLVMEAVDLAYKGREIRCLGFSRDDVPKISSRPC